MTYDPSIQRFVEESDERWGKPAEKRQLLYPYGIEPLDKALYGMDLRGDLITVQGEEKMRKTTTVENIAINGQLWFNAKLAGGEGVGVVRPLVAVDMLESGMGPDKYFDTLTANVAARYLIGIGHFPNPNLPCPMCGGKTACKELVLTHKFINYNEKSPAQIEAIAWAKRQMMHFKMHIYGPRPDQGDTRNLEASVTGTRDQKSRWQRLCEQYGKVIFVSDHLQQYDVRGTELEQQREVIPAHSNIVAKYGAVVFEITQVSMGSARDAAQGIGKITAMGGRKAAQESNTILSCNYVSGQGKVAITVEDSRDAGQFSIWQPIEENSGAFYSLPEYSWGKVTRAAKLEFRPGMKASNNGGGNGNYPRR